MSIRPIDLNGMIQNTQSLSNTHAAEEHRPLVQQEFAQETVNAEVEVAATQVQEQEDSSESALNPDREGAGSEYRGKKRSKNPKKKEKVPDGSVSVKKKHASFDIKI
ncbi:MAG: hypothetical protein IJV04_02975 [Lachnospiraceae bacterium]|nr:hypothetical protein [Lachnospiraceae bacterium]